ncbi:ribonuclease E/G [Ornithinimicrobium sufpigmenti]|uniref:ribonuclease E/G n=1 Tax=Ornithinimicrobium sufpigmenti TaxID=2508882 RepID=UPI001EE149FE|nr:MULTISPECIES: Rne/Rng family ribonuclease [unclassified Ornithinimicrobium]
MSDDSTTTDEAQERAARAAQLAAEAQALFGAGQGSTDDADRGSADGEDAAGDGTGDDLGEDTDDTGDTGDGGTAESAESAEAAGADEENDGSDDSDDSDELGGVPVVAVVDHDDDQSEDDESDQSEDDEFDEDDEDDEDDQDEAAPAAPALPSFGLVFQAPDLSDLPRRRSRRATSAPVTPVERPADEDLPRDRQVDEGDVDDDDADTRSGQGEDDGEGGARGRRRRRGGKGRRTRGGPDSDQADDDVQQAGEDGSQPQEGDAGGAGSQAEGGQNGSSTGTRTRTRSRRGRGSSSGSGAQGSGQAQTERADDSGPDSTEQPGGEQDDASSTRRRRRRSRNGQTERSAQDEVTSVKGSTRLEAKRQRRREGREAGRRRTIITEAEFLARRESVERVMVVRGLEDRTQIAVLEDGVPVEHYVSRSAQSTMAGNVYLGRVQNVLPSMEAAFVDIGKGRNAVLYAGEVNWDAAGLVGNEPRRIENALKSGESVLVQVTKDPIGHKGARLTSQISLPGRYLVYVPGSSMTGISRKLPENERARLKKILKEVVPADVGVIVRTAAEGASEAELRADVERLTKAWERIQTKAKTANAPALLHGEPDMTVRVIRDVFNEDFAKLIVSGEQAWKEVSRYIDDVAPDLAERVEKYTGTTDVFTVHRVHEAIAKAMDRKVWLPSGGSLVIDRTEAMTVVDVNTGKFTGSGGNLEETVTKNNIEAAEEIVRQLRLRDIGGIIVIDFIDMVLESNRDLVVRRLLECLGRDRTKHQVAEVTSLGLVQMTRKRVGSGLIEVFSETCTHCSGRGITVQSEPVGKGGSPEEPSGGANGGSRRGRGRTQNGRGNGGSTPASSMEGKNVLPPPNPNGPTPAQIAAAAHAAALSAGASSDTAKAVADEVAEDVVTSAVASADGDTATQGATSMAGDTASAATSAQPGPEPTKPARRRRGKAAVTAPVTQPEPTPTPQSEPTPAPQAQAEPAPQSEPVPVAQAEPTPAPQAEPEPAPRRRRRGRVVAPAGPPTGE